jgi:hypothetical protein
MQKKIERLGTSCSEETDAEPYPGNMMKTE